MSEVRSQGGLHVALLSFDFAEYCLRLADAMSQWADVTLMLPDRQVEPHGELVRALGGDIRLFHKPRLRQAHLQALMMARLVRMIRTLRPDVIHLQQGHAWFNLALPLLGGIPLVVTVHDPRHHVGDREGQKHPQAIYDFGFRRASALIVHSRTLREEVAGRLPIGPERIHVVPHIRLGESSTLVERETDEPTILFFGRIWEYKGLEYLIKAEPMISAAVPQARIVIAGEGEDFARYRRMMVNPERFTVLNEYVPDDVRAELFREASVVVLPYVDASQSGVVPLAYAAAKPVVATTVGGLPEAVEHGRTGLLVPPKDEHALAAAVVDLLRDPARRREFGRQGQQKLMTEYGEETIAAQTLNVYRAALHRPARLELRGEAP